MVVHDILILEPNKEISARLVRTLNRTGSFAITVVPNIKEACLHLIQTRKDLVFIPIEEGAKIIRSLRAIQPDVRLVLVTPAADIEIPVTYSGRVQGVLIEDMLEIELPAIIEEALAQPLFIREEAPPQPVLEKHSLDTAVLVSTFHQTELSKLIRTIILARNNKLLAYWGELNEREAATVSLHVGRDWPDDENLTRIQFMHLPARAGDLLLHTSQVKDDYLLTLAASPETPVSECRQQAGQLTPLIENIIEGKPSDAATRMAYSQNGKSAHGRVSFAIVWRPIEPLADALHDPIQKALLRLATANGCVLTHINVQPNLIHIVVTCPPGRDTSWAAYLFKSGSEQIIQQEYGVVISLWETGFYATESTTPLSKQELELFLTHTPIIS